GKEGGTAILPGMITTGATAAANPNDINFQELASRYETPNVPLPPGNTQVSAVVTNDAPDSVATANKPPVYKTTNVAIPDGYDTDRALIFAEATNDVPAK